MSKKKKKASTSNPQKNVATSNQSANTQPANTQQKNVSASNKQADNQQASNQPKSARTNKVAPPLSLGERLLGVLTLKPPVYREIAHAPNATMQAAIIVVIVVILSGIVAYLGANMTPPGLPDTRPSNPLGRAIVVMLGALLLWLGASFVIAQVAKNLFQGKTDTNEMLRVFGFTHIFHFLLALGVLAGTVAALISIAGLVLSIVGSIIGVREATGFTTGKAAIAAIFSIVLVWIAIAFFTAFVLNPFVTTLLPT